MHPYILGTILLPYLGYLALQYRFGSNLFFGVGENSDGVGENSYSFGSKNDGVRKKKDFKGEKSDFGGVKKDGVGKKSDFEGEKNEFEGEKNDGVGENSSLRYRFGSILFDEKNDGVGEKSDFGGVKNDGVGKKNDFEGEKSDFGGVNNDGVGKKNDFEGEKNEFEGKKSDFEGEKSDFEVKKDEWVTGEREDVNGYGDGWGDQWNDGAGKNEANEGQQYYDDYENGGARKEQYDGEEQWRGNVEGGSVGFNDGNNGSCSYSLRPDAEDCSFSMRTGTCKDGSNRRSNHPLKRKKQAARDVFKKREEHSDGPGPTECKYHSTPGGCKYGKACKNNHSRPKPVHSRPKPSVAPITPITEFNFLGLPMRVGEKECPSYMKTTSCKYGSNCRFNHPDPTVVGGGDSAPQGSMKDTIPGWSSARTLNENAPYMPVMYPPSPTAPPNGKWNEYQAARDVFKKREEHSDGPGPTECKYHSTPGGCKYGKTCRNNHSRPKPFHSRPKRSVAPITELKPKPFHSRPKPSVAPITEFNFLGLPMRVGEKECPSYMKTTSCKYGSNCRFNHPDPTVVGGGDSAPQGSMKDTIPGWSSARTLNENAPYMPVMYPPSPTAPPNGKWNEYQDPVYPISETNLPTPPAFASRPMNIPASDANFYAYPQQQLIVNEFPERPGQPECSIYLKTGDCKYRAACKFHHPKTRKTTITLISDRGLPLRPDQGICSGYSRCGICKYGPSCKYDHSVSNGTSA